MPNNNQRNIHLGTHLTRLLPSWRFGRLPQPRLTVRCRIISVNPRFVTCDEAFHGVLIRFCLLKGISGERHAVFPVFDGEDTRNEFRIKASQVQILSKLFASYRKIGQPLQKFHARFIAYLHELTLVHVSQNRNFCLLTVARIADRLLKFGLL
jgi:hypothetical protein